MCKQKRHLCGFGAKETSTKPTGSKWDQINPTGTGLEVVDVRAETTVEGRDILMIGPMKCDTTSLKGSNKRFKTRYRTFR